MLQLLGVAISSLVVSREWADIKQSIHTIMKTETINASNVDSLSYSNVLRMCELSRFADPVLGIKATGEQWECTMDDQGNIMGGHKLHADELLPA